MASHTTDILATHPVLREIVNRLVKTFHPERIYLFGSYARGDASHDSDFDLLMVVHDSPLPRYRRDQEAFLALVGVGASKDIVVFTRDEFTRGLKVMTSLPASVEREGILLYGA